MNIEEVERVVVAKPVASRPNCSTFKSFSELLAGAINAAPPIASSSQTTTSAIRPKTVRFKPTLNLPPSQVSEHSVHDRIDKSMLVFQKPNGLVRF